MPAGYLPENCGSSPHTRGFCASYFIGQKVICGSSPHTRGFCPVNQWVVLGLRFIPAYAGLLYSGIYILVPITVHPRIRGAFSGNLFPLPVVKRFIPAYAGLLPLPGRTPRPLPVHPRIRGAFGRSRSWSRRVRPVHPRIRGAFRGTPPLPIPVCGSSPHTRGFYAYKTVCNGGSRVIPAYAGLLPARG